MLHSLQRVLVLAPHTDDGEFGCGGSICKWAQENKDVYYVAFSSAEKSVLPGMEKDILKKEVKKATHVLGIKTANLTILNYPVREFLSYRQQILEDMVRLQNELNPDLVLLPSTNDTHQDHQTISQEGFRAFKKSSMIGYEMPHNNLNFSTHLFTILNLEHLERKIEALKFYESQAHKTYANEGFIKSLARVRGTQIGVEYAEAFEVVRWIIK